MVSKLRIIWKQTVEEMVSLFEPPHVVGCKGSDPSLVEKVDYPKEPVKDELAEVPWRNNMASFKLYRFVLVMCVHSQWIVQADLLRLSFIISCICA